LTYTLFLNLFGINISATRYFERTGTLAKQAKKSRQRRASAQISGRLSRVNDKVYPGPDPACIAVAYCQLI
jgi:hypothetical protein